MRTKEQYLADLKKMRKNVYLDGVAIGRDDPRVIKAANVIGVTFDLVDDPEYKDLLTTISPLTG